MSWRPRATIATVLVLAVCAGCTINFTSAEPEAADTRVRATGVVWHTASTCRGTTKLLDGATLVFTDPSGEDVASEALSGTCLPPVASGDTLIPPRNAMVVRASYSVYLPPAAEYTVHFVPGEAFGDRPLASGPQAVTPAVLDAASSRMDFDTGDDGPDSSTPGGGIVIGPRLCAGFPAAGCEP